MSDTKINSPRNKTIMLSTEEIDRYKKKLLRLENKVFPKDILNSTINQELFTALDFLPASFVDLLFIDPPYNLNKDFLDTKFSRTSIDKYTDYIDSWLSKLVRILKPGASVYICGDYFSSTSIHLAAQKYFTVRNRITWQREKGRGAKANWKNSSEDIWFCTYGNDFKFFVDRVKEKRKVIAPYRESGKPKDWEETPEGNFRLTHPSNIWTDLTIPYWSMPENTEHPTQKPEKLLAKIILASSDEGDVIFDPFLGSGTTSVVAKKLGRRFVGIEKEEYFCLLAEKRLHLAENDSSIQGYTNGVFWERNSLSEQKKHGNNNK
ncbi:MAG: site-specific DNA-methyltransferase [Ignavibacteria bacterium]|nr:site-specific DNA-methyltransferase [Ignavibacteria bacterium]